MKRKPIAVVLTIVLIATIILLVGQFKWSAENHKLVSSSIQKQGKVTYDYLDDRNFYQKMNSKKDVALKFLILGDSIGQSSGTGDSKYFWFNQLSQKIKQKYNVSDIEINKITSGGATIFDGLINYLPASSINLYDLVFICFGQNDQAVTTPNEFGSFYENLIRKAKQRNQTAEICTIIESSIKDERFANVIKMLSEKYNTILIDTRIPFRESGKSNDQLTVDSIHPTNEGYTMYANQMFSEISDDIQKNKKVPTMAKQLNYPDKQYDNIKFLRSPISNKGFTIDKFGYLSSNKKGDFLEYKFSGNMVGFTLYGTDDSGIIDVYLDGEKIQEINPYVPKPREKNIFVADNLSNKTHSLKLVVSGKEGFDYKGKPTKGTTVKISKLILNQP